MNDVSNAITFDEIMSVALPTNMRCELIDAAQSRGQGLADFVVAALAGAIAAAGSPDPGDDHFTGRRSRPMES